MNDPAAQPAAAQQPAATQPKQYPALYLKDIQKSFVQGARRLSVLRGANVILRPGETVGLLGPSGSGKSTLLNIAGVLEAPDSGVVGIAGVNVAKLSSRQRAQLRRTKIGFVFQFHRLLPEFSAAENIIIPQMLARQKRGAAKKRAMELLDMVGLAERAGHRPGQLSGGEQQRVAIARAVANAPGLLLADEPTGNLDPETAAGVFTHLQAITRNTGAAALIVTHNTELAGRMDRVLMIRDGSIADGETPPA